MPTPTLERLAKAGLRYTQFHTTALCSPTRARRELVGASHLVFVYAGKEAAEGRFATSLDSSVEQRVKRQRCSRRLAAEKPLQWLAGTELEVAGDSGSNVTASLDGSPEALRAARR